jgi:hypothetical protein
LFSTDNLTCSKCEEPEKILLALKQEIGNKIGTFRLGLRHVKIMRTAGLWKLSTNWVEDTTFEQNTLIVKLSITDIIKLKSDLLNGTISPGHGPLSLLEDVFSPVVLTTIVPSVWVEIEGVGLFELLLFSKSFSKREAIIFEGLLALLTSLIDGMHEKTKNDAKSLVKKHNTKIWHDWAEQAK